MALNCRDNGAHRRPQLTVSGCMSVLCIALHTQQAKSDVTPVYFRDMQLPNSGYMQPADFNWPELCGQFTTSGFM